jgi:cytochrome c556
MVRSGFFIGAMALAMGLAGCSGGQQGQEVQQETQGVEAGENPREANFKAIAKANKAIGDELKKPSPALDVIASNAKDLDELAQALPSWFPGATGPEPGIETEALPAIWEKPAEFQETAEKFATATAALQAAVGTGSIEAVKAAAGAAAANCKACHTNFRQKK